MKKANGRLHPHLFGTLVFFCNGTAGDVVVLRVFRDALDHCVARQNPSGATLVVAALISLSDAKSFIGNGKGTVLPYSPPFI